MAVRERPRSGLMISTEFIGESMEMEAVMIEIYDTTLRDGTQRNDISLSCDDKIRIAQKLDEIGITYIEGGWPGSNPKDVEFFEKASKINGKHADITAFGSTCRANSNPEEDANIQALLDSRQHICHSWGKPGNFM